MAMIENIAPTRLTGTYDKDYHGTGTLYAEKKSAGGTLTDRVWCWGKMYEATVTCVGKIPCVRIPSTTNQGLFSPDYSDANDVETRMNIGIPYASSVSTPKYLWFLVKGVGKMRQGTTVTTVAQYDPFRITDDKTIATSTTPYNAAGIFMENPGTTATDERFVLLHGKNY